jgi:hypothetical protein
MGLEIKTSAEIPRLRLLGRRPPRDQILSEVSTAVMQAVADPLLRSLVRREIRAHTLAVHLHPVAEPIYFTWAPEGKLWASAKTSTSGPGYHAQVIDILRSIGRCCQLNWCWAGSDVGDDTEYALIRDFQDLQEQMARFLGALAQGVVESYRNSRRVALNMPAGYAVIRSEKVITPLGPLRWGRLEKLADWRGQDLLTGAQEFYAWWNRACDADFWRKYGLSIAWCNLKYRLPMNHEERVEMETAREALQRADRLEAGSAQEQLLSEIEQLLAADPGEHRSPRPEGVGYLRGVVTLPATGLWSVDLPGWWHREVTPDAGELCFWWQGRSVRISSLSVEDETGHVPQPEALLSGRSRPQQTPDVEFRHGRRIGWAHIGPADDEADEYELQGTLAVPGSLAMVTIRFEDPSHRSWAIDTFQGIRHPREDQDTDAD